MAPHPSTLAWKIPWMEEPCRLPSVGLLRVDTTERLQTSLHLNVSIPGQGQLALLFPVMIIYWMNDEQQVCVFLVSKIFWRSFWLPTPVFSSGEFHGERRLTGYSPWGPKEPDRTDWLSLDTLTLKKCLLLWQLMDEETSRNKSTKHHWWSFLRQLAQRISGLEEYLR